MNKQLLNFLLTAGLMLAAVSPSQAQLTLNYITPSPVCPKPVKVFGYGYMDLGSNGEANANVNVYCSGYFVKGVVEAKTYFADSQIEGFVSKKILNVSLSGRTSPIVTINGTCASAPAIKGCHFQVLIADNGDGFPDPADILMIRVYNGFGDLISGGMGALSDGNFTVNY